jgi:hypothetical protein
VVVLLLVLLLLFAWFVYRAHDSIVFVGAGAFRF